MSTWTCHKCGAPCNINMRETAWCSDCLNKSAAEFLERHQIKGSDAEQYYKHLLRRATTAPHKDLLTRLDDWFNSVPWYIAYPLAALFFTLYWGVLAAVYINAS